MTMEAKGLMRLFGRNRWRIVLLTLLFALLEILDRIFASPDGGGYCTDNEQRHDDDPPDTFAAVLLHEP